MLKESICTDYTASFAATVADGRETSRRLSSNTRPPVPELTSMPGLGSGGCFENASKALEKKS